MIIFEGARRIGKSHTISVLQSAFPNLIFYKDKTLQFAKYLDIDIDDYVLSRDYTYCQLITTMPEIAANKLVFDRQYFSSYVYGQIYRNRFSKEFWQDHIQRVEKCYGDFLNVIKIILIDATESDLEKMASINRKKDQFETNNIEVYRQQIKLYNEVANISSANIFRMKAFQDDSYIIETFRKIFLS